jgi:hypothetical protein
MFEDATVLSAGDSAAPGQHPLRLRPTMLSDLDWVVSVETDLHNLPFITPWERPQHEGAVRFPPARCTCTPPKVL